MVFLLFRFCVLMRLSICLQTRPFSLSAESKSADRRLLILFLKQFRRMNRVVVVAPEGNKSEKLTYPRKSSSQNPKTDHLKGQTSDKLLAHFGYTSYDLYQICQLLYINRTQKISQIKLCGNWGVHEIEKDSWKKKLEKIVGKGSWKGQLESVV